jgi:hypothetical protein
MVQTPYPGIYSSGRFWITLLLVSPGAAAAFFGIVVAIAIIVVQARSLLSRSERYTLWAARNSADEEGMIQRVGPITLWWSGPDDPAPMLKEQMEIARGQFENLVAEPVDLGRPLRILCFSKRSSFVHYHRRSVPNLWNLDGLYVPSPVPTLTFLTDHPPYRWNDPPRIVRSLFNFHFLRTYKGFLPPFWLLHGIGISLSNWGRVDRLEILNRKVMLSLARQSVPDMDLFRLGRRALFRLVRNWYDHDGFSTFSDLTARAWSMIEYLCGPEAPLERRERFRAFLKELRARRSQEATFQRHFGFGFEGLLKKWREWVMEHGLGGYAPPPPEIQRALMNAIIPTIKDRDARIMDRIQAIREIGRVGYVMGADALIDLLGTDDMLLIPEIVWSLRAVSGRRYDDDADRWQAWMETVPVAAIRGEQ